MGFGHLRFWSFCFFGLPGIFLALRSLFSLFLLWRSFYGFCHSALGFRLLDLASCFCFEPLLLLSDFVFVFQNYLRGICFETRYEICNFLMVSLSQKFLNQKIS